MGVAARETIMNPRILGIIGGLALVVALLSPFILGSSKKVKQLFEAAETLYEQNDYEDAIAKYKEALKESKKLRTNTKAIDEDFTTFVNFKIALSYVKLAEHRDNPIHYEKALEHVEKAAQTVELAEYEEKLTYLWGYVLYKTGQLEKAEEKLTQLIENFPNSPFEENAQKTITQIKEQLPDSEEKETEEVVPPIDHIPLWINDLSKFEAFNKKNNRTLVIPNRLRAERQYIEAAEQYEDFADSNSSTAEEAAYALYWSGWCYYKATSDDIAILNKSCIVFQRLVDQHNNSSYIHEGREKLIEIKKLKLQGKSSRAIIDAEETVHRVQQSDCQSDAIHKAITHLGNAKREQEQGNYAEALTLANKAQTIAHDTIDNHETAKRYVNQGSTYLNQGRLEMATKKARDALNIDPPYQHANELLEKIKKRYFDQGTNYVEIEEYDRAIPLLKKAITIDSQFKEAYCNLGRAHLKLGEFEQAIAAAEKALAIDPNYECARNIISSIDIGEN